MTAFLWPLEPAAIARFADQAAGLHGAADTALHLRAQDHPAAEAVALDAVDALQGKAPPPLDRPPRAFWALLLLLLLGIGARAFWPEPQPEPTPEPTADEKLAEIEAEARRQGQDDLAEATRQLRSRLAQTQPAIGVQRHEKRDAAPPPPPPEIQELPPRPPQLPQEMETPEEYEQALELAIDTMASDDALLAAIAEDIYNQLTDISFESELGINFLEQGLADQELGVLTAQEYLEGEGGDKVNDKPLESFDMFGQQMESLNNQFIEEGAMMQTNVDPQVEGRDVGTEAHETKANLMQSYRDFMKEYSEALRDELIKAIQEAADPDAWKEQGEDAEEGEKGSGPSMPGGPPPDKQDAQQSAQLRPSGGEVPEGAQAMAAPADAAGGKPSGRGQASTGGGDSAGRRTGGGAQAAGELAQVQGKLEPGNLGDEQREAVLDGVSSRSVQTGPGQEFDQAWGGYFDEVEATLSEEDIPPQMEGMVRAYFAGLQE